MINTKEKFGSTLLFRVFGVGAFVGWLGIFRGGWDERGEGGGGEGEGK